MTKISGEQKTTPWMASAARMLLTTGMMLAGTASIHAQETRYYDIRVGTANEFQAGTNARVYITLYGLNSSVGPDGGPEVELDSPTDDFEPGSIRTYRVAVDGSIGAIARIKLRQDNTGGIPAWKPTFVQITDPNTKDEYGTADQPRFVINRWLADDRGTRKSDVTVLRENYDEWVKTPSPAIASVPQGYWVVACSGSDVCTSKVTKEFRTDSSETNSVSSDFRNVMEVSLTAGIEVAGASASTTLKTGFEWGIQEAKEIAQSQQLGVTQSCGTEVNLRENKEQAVWQWVISQRIGTQEVQLQTCLLTCTAGGEDKPNYAPLSRQAGCGVSDSISQQPVANTPPPPSEEDAVHYATPLLIQNKYANWGSYLDARFAGCEGNLFCVSAADVPNKSQSASSTWRLFSAHGTVSNDGPVRFGQPVHLEIKAHGRNAYLDTNGGGCEGNKLCVSASEKLDRAGVSTGIWTIVSTAGKSDGELVLPGDEFHLRNEWTGGATYLDTNGGGCEGNKYCVSASATGNRAGVGTGIWRFR